MPPKSSAEAAALEAAIASSRKLGNGFALALRVGPAGSDMHLTLCYFNNLKRGYEQDMVKQMAAEYFQSKNISTIDLVLGERHAERSVRVRGAVEEIVKDFQEVFAKFSLVPDQVPHVDLRGTVTLKKTGSCGGSGDPLQVP